MTWPSIVLSWVLPVYFSAACLVAQQTTPSLLAAESFKQLDRNGDGRISKEQFPGPLFDRLDANQDVFITLEESQGVLSRRQGPDAASSKPNATSGDTQPQSLMERIKTQRGDIEPQPHK